MKLSSGIFAALALGATYVAYNRFTQRASLDIRNKLVLITGGSRGLGLATAIEFGLRGARVAICSRDAAELERAKSQLVSRGISAYAFVCDVTNRLQVCEMVDKIISSLGVIDVLVNNAGAITVGPVDAMTVEDFEEAMNVMFWGPLYATLAVLPSMQERGNGSIVNITSIGGKIAVPHLLPYSCAKFATVALSEGLREELAPKGIRVTTIAPGLMRTGSHLHAKFKGDQAAEYSWFAAGAATPFFSIGARRAAQSIVQATVRGDSEKILSVPADLTARAHGIFPGLSTELLAIVNRMLPLPGKLPTSGMEGQEIERGFSSSVWKIITTLGRHAADSLNEAPAVSH